MIVPDRATFSTERNALARLDFSGGLGGAFGGLGDALGSFGSGSEGQPAMSRAPRRFGWRASVRQAHPAGLQTTRILITPY